MDIETGWHTDRGNRKPLNEDHADVIRFSSDAGLPEWFLVVADGMGGYSGGEVAAEKTVEEMVNFIESTKYTDDPQKMGNIEGRKPLKEMESAVDLVNKLLYNYSRLQPRLKKFGSTVVAAWLKDNRAHVVHLGDSRAYLFRGASRLFRTEDHAEGGKLTRRLGLREEVEADKREIELNEGDILLLCTDGLTKELDDDEIAEVVTQCRRAENRKTAQEVSEELVGAAKGRKGRDNITVVVAYVRGLSVLAERRSRPKSAGSPDAAVSEKESKNGTGPASVGSMAGAGKSRQSADSEVPLRTPERTRLPRVAGAAPVHRRRSGPASPGLAQPGMQRPVKKVAVGVIAAVVVAAAAWILLRHNLKNPTVAVEFRWVDTRGQPIPREQISDFALRIKDRAGGSIILVSPGSRPVFDVPFVQKPVEGGVFRRLFAWYVRSVTFGKTEKPPPPDSVGDCWVTAADNVISVGRVPDASTLTFFFKSLKKTVEKAVWNTAGTKQSFQVVYDASRGTMQIQDAGSVSKPALNFVPGGGEQAHIPKPVLPLLDATPTPRPAVPSTQVPTVAGGVEIKTSEHLKPTATPTRVQALSRVPTPASAGRMTPAPQRSPTRAPDSGVDTTRTACRFVRDGDFEAAAVEWKKSGSAEAGAYARAVENFQRILKRARPDLSYATRFRAYEDLERAMAGSSLPRDCDPSPWLESRKKELDNRVENDVRQALKSISGFLTTEKEIEATSALARLEQSLDGLETPGYKKISDDLREFKRENAVQALKGMQLLAAGSLAKNSGLRDEPRFLEKVRDLQNLKNTAQNGHNTCAERIAACDAIIESARALSVWADVDFSPWARGRKRKVEDEAGTTIGKLLAEAGEAFERDMSVSLARIESAKGFTKCLGESSTVGRDIAEMTKQLTSRAFARGAFRQAVLFAEEDPSLDGLARRLGDLDKQESSLARKKTYDEKLDQYEHINKEMRDVREAYNLGSSDWADAQIKSLDDRTKQQIEELFDKVEQAAGGDSKKLLDDAKNLLDGSKRHPEYGALKDRWTQLSQKPGNPDHTPAPVAATYPTVSLPKVKEGYCGILLLIRAQGGASLSGVACRSASGAEEPETVLFRRFLGGYIYAAAFEAKNLSPGEVEKKWQIRLLPSNEMAALSQNEQPAGTIALDADASDGFEIAVNPVDLRKARWESLARREVGETRKRTDLYIRYGGVGGAVGHVEVTNAGDTVQLHVLDFREEQKKEEQTR
jgi:serine/threonine protein phosphatase PrpC